jgi:metal-responsive CopG/Arc/MetJ family transcriptional regulator
MKTAISIPDPVFKEADNLAKRLGVSRSELYTKAVLAFVEEHRGEQIIAALNAVYRQESSELDSELQKLQALAVTSEEW